MKDLGLRQRKYGGQQLKQIDIREGTDSMTLLICSNTYELGKDTKIAIRRCRDNFFVVAIRTQPTYWEEKLCVVGKARYACLLKEYIQSKLLQNENYLIITHQTLADILEQNNKCIYTVIPFFSFERASKDLPFVCVGLFRGITTMEPSLNKGSGNTVTRGNLVASYALLPEDYGKEYSPYRTYTDFTVESKVRQREYHSYGSQYASIFMATSDAEAIRLFKEQSFPNTVGTVDYLGELAC